jgi:riboflavin kinase / FMN adenylyltransferase
LSGLFFPSPGDFTVSLEEELAVFAPEKDSMITIGVFDGVHLGHKQLIAELLKQARQKKMSAGVITFRQHPENVLLTDHKTPLLTDIATRTHLLKDAGVDFVIILAFTKDLSQMDARSFMRLLQKKLKMRGLIIGPDFALGKDRQGDIESLLKIGKDMDFSVTVVPPLKINGEVVSSTAIRKAIAEGNMEKYEKMTGRHFSLHGKVTTGAGRGEGLGFPTANLDVKAGQAIPPDGVYCGLARMNGHTYQAMTNIGRNPTFGENDRTVESFILDYQGNLYGREISVDFVSRLREEKKFRSIEELKKQVAEDVKLGKRILDSCGKS